MRQSLKTVESRKGLKPRREPYWESIRRGCYIGFRKMTKGSLGTWLARWRDETSGKQHYSALGEFEQLPPSDRRDAAMKAAEEWLKHVGAGGSTEAMTVVKVCAAYVAHLESNRRDATAKDAKKRFARWVDEDKVLNRIEVAKLQPAQVVAWRKRLTEAPIAPGSTKERPRSLSAVNRDMSSVRAALNYALEQRLVMSDGAWRVALRPHKAADSKRDLYIDRKQRRALIAKAAPDVGTFLRALSLLPLRPGALASLDVAHFDKRLGALKVGKDKAGNDRTLPLPATTVTFFGTCAKDALPAAPLLRRANGCRWNKDSWKGPVKDAVVAAKLPTGATAYTLRHSVITDLVHGGLDTLTVAQLSGTSVVMIEKHYGHLKAEHARAALATLAL
jgi:integrase